MFGRSNVFATLTKFAGVRVKDEREQDRNYVVEVEFEAPLTYELAEDLNPAVARDLFDQEGADAVAKRELSEVRIGIPVGRQIMTVRQHPELEPIGRLAGVEIRRILASKSKAGTWLLSWVIMFGMDDLMVIALIRLQKVGVYLTFEVQEPALGFEGTDGKTAAAGPDLLPDEPETDAPAAGKGKGRGRGRGKRGQQGANVVAMPTKTCPDCGTEFPANVLNCPQCGARVGVPAPTVDTPSSVS